MNNTHSRDLIVTDIFLNDQFRNKQSAIIYKITCPDGYIEMLRQALSEGCQVYKLFSHLGAQIEQQMEEREVRGCNINGTILKQIDLNVLQYTSETKKEAAITYLKNIKPELNKMGYTILKHECYPYKLKKIEPDCHGGTLDQMI